MAKKDKRQKVKRKNEKREKHVAQSLLQRRETYRRVINIAGAGEYLSKLPNNLLKSIYNISYPSLHIETDISNNINTNNFLKHLKNVVKNEYNSAFVEIDNVHFKLSDTSALHILQQLFTSLYNDVNNTIKRASQKHINTINKPKLREELKPELNAIQDNVKKIIGCLNELFDKYNVQLFEKLLAIVYKEIVKHFNYNNGIYPIVSTVVDDSGKVRPSVKIKVLPSKLTTVKIGRDLRKVYRCCALIHSSKHPDGIIPVVIEPNVINNNKPLDVYIQDHALSRIKERLNIDPIGYVYDCIGRSMLHPVVAGMSGPSYMIEYRYFSHKMGYLIVTVENNIALIRSFKFITMTGTPEFYALKSRLGGSREDFEYLGLDNLDTLLNSDIEKDVKLRKIFDDCGLGHLFGLADVDSDETNKIASEIRRYFRIK